MENKLSEEEVVTALELCVDSNCGECPYTKKNIDCSGGRQEKDCIWLINKLGGPTARNNWKNKFLTALKEKEELQKRVDELTPQTEWLTNENSYLKKCADSFLGDYKNACKDTAKEIFQDLYNAATSNVSETVELTSFQIVQLAKRYGVEVE